MSTSLSIACHQGGRPLAVGWLALILAGCHREPIQVYQVPKERPAAEEAAPQVRWALPSGWLEKPAGGMRVGSFAVPGKNGRTADVSVIPLAGMPENELDNVNRWRGQIGLTPIAADELSRQTEKVKIGPADGHLFDLVSAGLNVDGKYRARMLGAILQRGDTTWFFKMTGDEATVGEGKPAFVQFLRSIQFAAGPGLNAASSVRRPMSTNVRDIPTDAAGKPVWNVPANWQEQPPSAMLIATYLVTDANGGQARVTISSFPGDVGGPLANVNRWRAQLGLPPVEAAGLDPVTRSLDVEGGKAMLVDMTGTDAKTGRKARLVAVMVPRGTDTWFFKMIGDDSVVAQEKDAFLRFVQTVRYPHG